MAWSYSGDPSSSSRDEVRFLIGDTDADDQLLQDSEVDYLVSVSPDGSGHNYLAASAACDAIAARYAKQISKSVGSLSIQLSEKYQHYKELADTLYDMATKGALARKPGPPRLGGGGQTFLWPDAAGQEWDAE